MLATEKAGARPGHHATALLAEADRLMTVCNSCRYCEGLCAVFPAMEMRRAFPDGDLNYLANLCHGCGACYVDCQFSPPHEFDVNVPRVLAQVRNESYAAYAWPRALAPMFARNGFAISVVAGLSVAAFILGFAAWHDACVIFGTHTGPGAFYKLMPHYAMAWLFGLVFFYAIVALAFGLRAFWRDIGDPRGSRRRAVAGDARRRHLALSRWRRHRLLQSRRPAERPPPVLSSPHLLRLRALLRLHLRGDALSLSARARGAVSVVGPAGRARHRRRHRAHFRAARADDRQAAARSRHAGRGARSVWTSRSSPCCSHQPHGAAVAGAARDSRDAAAAGTASRRGVRAVYHHAVREIRARPLSLRRAGALRQEHRAFTSK